MRRRGFTFIELSFAMTISAILLVSFGVMLTSIWIMAKESTDELQCIVRAEFLRQKFFYRLTDDKGNDLGVGGLPSAKLISFKEENAVIEAEFENAAPWRVDLSNGNAVKFFGLDASKRDFRQPEGKNSLSLQYIYRAIPIGGKTVYYDRLIIPIILSNQSTVEDLQIAEFKEIFGG